MASVRSVVGLAVLVLAGPTALVRAQAQWTEALQTCGAARYFASEYSCFGNRTLCPVMYNLPTVPCATGAVDGGSCYAPEMFSCAPGGKLETLPAASTPFTLTAHGTRATYRNLTVKACGGFLAIGANARQCTSCAGAGPGVQCAAYGNKAVLLPSGEMASDIPGGQYWFINPLDGALQYVTGNETAERAFAGHNVTVYQNGFFSPRDTGNAHYWLACLRLLPGGVPGTGRTWRLYAPTAQNLEKDCEQVRLAATAVDRKQGAYKFE